MKYKKTLIIIGILIALLSSCLVCYFFYEKKSINNSPRTKVELIMGDIYYDQALKIGQESFKNTTLLLANKFLDYEEEYDKDINLYLIEGIDGYAKVLNYNNINDFLSYDAKKDYNNYVKYINYEGKDYVREYNINTNKEYVGSIIDIKQYNDKEIIYTALNYYCDNSYYKGLIESVPLCNINDSFITEFSMVKENNLLKIKDINEFLNTKKIY